MPYHENILSAIGNTPLVKLQRVVHRNSATVLVKAEYMNPAGSIKDRMALHIIEKAEKAGHLKPGGTIVENTSGNTGMGVALAAAVKGYRCIFTMPDKMSEEKRNMLRSFGAEVVVTPTNVPADSPESYYETARRIARETPGSFYLDQYDNPINIEAHYQSTGAEIWRQTEGKFDAFVAGIGTGGTMSGAGKYFKERNPEIKNIAVDPIGSVYKALYETGTPSEPHVYKVEGIGEDRICKAMDFTFVDEVRNCDDRTAFHMSRRLTREEGLFAGGSSGSAVAIAIEVARELGPDKTVVSVLPDSATRYITKYFSDDWMKEHGFMSAAGDPYGKVGDMLNDDQEVLVAQLGESLSQAVERMRSNGISQLPVLGANKECEGMLHEVDVLSTLLQGNVSIEDKIDAYVQPLQGAVNLETPVLKLNEIFNADNVAVVLDDGQVRAVITKIDLISYLSKNV